MKRISNAVGEGPLPAHMTPLPTSPHMEEQEDISRNPFIRAVILPHEGSNFMMIPSQNPHFLILLLYHCHFKGWLEFHYMELEETYKYPGDMNVCVCVCVCVSKESAPMFCGG